MQEVRARAGVLYVLADADTHIESAEGLHVIRMPEHYGALSPVVARGAAAAAGLPHGLRAGTDVDKPRNLAKSVTVEDLCGTKSRCSAAHVLVSTMSDALGP